MASTSSGLDREALVSIAASLRVVADDAWNAFIVGEPDLRPDAGRAELARGTAGGKKWLLQSAPLSGMPDLIGPDLSIDTSSGVDPCLKVERLQRVCATAGSAGSYTAATGRITSSMFPGVNEDLRGLPPFLLVTTSERGAAVRVTAAGRASTTDLVEVDGGRRWAAVVFVDEPGFALCTDPPPDAPTDVATQRVEVLDDAGAVAYCIGMGA